MVADQFFSGLMLCKIETCAKKLYWSVSGICLWCFAKLSMCDMAKEKGDVSQKNWVSCSNMCTCQLEIKYLICEMPSEFFHVQAASKGKLVKLLMQCLQLVLVVRIEMQNTDSILKACCQIVFIKRLFQTLIESFTKSQTLQIVRQGHHHQHILFDTKLHVLLESDTSGADSSCRSDDFNKTWEKCRQKGPDSSLKGSRDGWTYSLSLSPVIPSPQRPFC